MKKSTKEAVNSILELHEQCDERLGDLLNALLIYIENFSAASKIDSATVQNLTSKVKDFMNSYHLWMGNSLDDLVSTLPKSKDHIEN